MQGAPRKSLFGKLMWHLLRINTSTTIKAYRGFANNNSIVLYGHVLKISPVTRRHFRKNFLINLLALIRLFIVKPVPRALLCVEFAAKTYYTNSEDDGFFRFEIPLPAPLQPGWHYATIQLIRTPNKRTVVAEAPFFSPFLTQYGFISDIDDTFLISHSATIAKRLYVLFTKNAWSRKPFTGVVNHYQWLSSLGTDAASLNPFFYVSSSEWNLYDYILEFASKNKLPSGVYLLNQMKTFSQLLNTGKNKHKTKFFRITRILEAFPNLEFVLLGDDTQEDPAIYAAVVKHFPNRIKAVYIRQLKDEATAVAEQSIQEIRERNVEASYFRHSDDALQHSAEIFNKEVRANQT